jgi:hypothetical protein
LPGCSCSCSSSSRICQVKRHASVVQAGLTAAVKLPPLSTHMSLALSIHYL